MRAFRNGEQVYICDGCFEPIPNYKAKTHNILVNKKRGFHAHSIGCARKAKKKPSVGTLCSTDGCGLLVATGELTCMNKHPQ